MIVWMSQNERFQQNGSSNREIIVLPSRDRYSSIILTLVGFFKIMGNGWGLVRAGSELYKADRISTKTEKKPVLAFLCRIRWWTSVVRCAWIWTACLVIKVVTRAHLVRLTIAKWLSLCLVLHSIKVLISRADIKLGLNRLWTNSTELTFIIT